MKFSNILFLFNKELKGLLRDKRTILVSVLIPLLFYPSLIKGLDHFQQNEAKRLESLKPIIAAVGQENNEIVDVIKNTGNFKIVELDNLIAKEELAAGKIQGVLEFSNIRGISEGGVSVNYRYKLTDARSRISFERLNTLVDEYNAVLVKEKIRSMGLSNSILEPISLSGIDTSSKEELTGMAFFIIPYIMVTTILAGAGATGMDLTAGEKERGTLATLLSSQLSKGEIAIGKVAVTAFVGSISSILSVIGLVAAIKMSESSDLSITALFPKTLILMIVILLPTALLIGSIIMNLGLCARSIKEGNSYTTPLYLIVLFLGVLTTVEGFTLPKTLYYIPILNTVFALQSLLSFQFNNQLFFNAIVSTLAYSIVSIMLSVKLFERECVLFKT
ncbi:ABC transporter permease subunit [Alkalibaculum bacchi]|uniref:ABC transporter permease subunit n=1 Tax=Alkalibaculum bacchi TaxID=645887 RepID=UPI0026EC92AF|nr:ABC transporter permease subunit [Alkalibaculum bacchi]